jgi:hypothetical protein
MGHNFHVGWHFKFKVEMCKKSWSTPIGVFHQRRENYKVGVQFMKNPFIKTPMRLCTVVEGSEIYNFGINTLMHFSYKILRKTRSKEAAPKHFHAGMRACALDVARRSTSAAAASPYTPTETGQ